MLKYKCLVFDHDDTTVNSSANIHYPCFVEFMKIHRPNLRITLHEFMLYNFDPGVIPFFTDICGLNEEELLLEQNFWEEFARQHVADAFPGIKEIMEMQKAQGGLIAVVSHSFADNILRDYEHNDLPVPDEIFGWEQPVEERKPAPVPIQKLMAKYDLQASDILVIDDLKPGLDMARAVGVDFCAAGWCFDIPENERHMRAHATVYCKTLDELKRYLALSDK